MLSRMRRTLTARLSRCWFTLAVLLLFSLNAFGAAAPDDSSEVTPPSTPREFFNAGSKKLREGKLREAEALLQTALAAQQESLQPSALYNLGHVRFAQGIDELKKGPTAGPSLSRGDGASRAADGAIQEADEALAGTDIQRLVSAYLRGRGARRGLRDAAKAVRQAMEAYGTVLSRWQRASGDFKSAVELNPQDADAAHNADVVDRCIAKLVDSLRQLQQMAAAMEQKKQELGEKMKQMRGRIPDDQMPPGAAGDDEEEEDKPNGPRPEDQESPGREGEEQRYMSPEQAAWLLEGFKLDKDRRLPMGQQEAADPKIRPRRTW